MDDLIVMASDNTSQEAPSSSMLGGTRPSTTATSTPARAIPISTDRSTDRSSALRILNGTSSITDERKPHRTQSLSVTVPKSSPIHNRAASVATSSPAGRKRLSLSFPVLPPGYDPPPRNSYAPSIASTTRDSPGTSSGDVSPEDSASFLTVLAAQERRVLELREELSKAETELTKLKRQWANHEANKTRMEILNPGSFIAPQRVLGSDRGGALSSPTNREEYQRRQKTANSATAGRKILPSQRHQRTLSLLSPERSDFRQPFPRPSDVEEGEEPPSRKRHSMITPSVASETATSAAAAAARAQSLDLPSDRAKNSQESFLTTGQQIAADFRDGLWSFLGDLKQVTVGDDTPRSAYPSVSRSNTANGTNPNTVRRVSSKSNLRSTTNANSPDRIIPPTMERRPTTSKSKKRYSTILPPEEAEALLIDFSSDEAEREPSFRWSSSTTLSDFPDANGIITPPSRGSTPRTSTSSINFQYTHLPSKPIITSTSISTSSTTTTTIPDDYTGYNSHGLSGMSGMSGMSSIPSIPSISSIPSQHGMEINTKLIHQEIFKTQNSAETTSLPRGNCSGYAPPPPAQIAFGSRNRIRARSCAERKYQRDNEQEV